jgi:hypothetical protein
MLISALDRHPYSYYTLLRWVVCGVAAYVTYVAFQTEKAPGAWLFGIMALLFNPIIPVHLSRATWQPIDVLSAIIFIASVFWIQPSSPQASMETQVGVEDTESESHDTDNPADQ